MDRACIWCVIWTDAETGWALKSLVVADPGAVIGESEIVAVAAPGCTTEAQATRALKLAMQRNA